MQAGKAEFCRQRLGLCHDGRKGGGVKPHQIHFVDGQHRVADAHHGHDAAVAAGLHLQALARIHQQHGQAGGGGTGGHVAGVLRMARRVGHPKAALRRGKEPVGHVDGDALLALGLQAVKQQGQVGLRALGAKLV